MVVLSRLGVQRGWICFPASVKGLLVPNIFLTG